MRCGLSVRRVPELLIVTGFGVIVPMVLLFGGFARGSRVPTVVSAPIIGGDLLNGKFPPLI